jgi:hypothetical protein
MASKKKAREESPEHEHLGWRASSAVPAKKHKLIEGECTCTLCCMPAEAAVPASNVAGRGYSRHQLEHASLQFFVLFLQVSAARV